VVLKRRLKMTDYKNYKPKTDLTPWIEGICFVGVVLLSILLFLLLAV
jgi:hypothetical protein